MTSPLKINRKFEQSSVMEELRKQLQCVSSPYQKDFLELLTKGEEVFYRHHFVPGHFTASAFVYDPQKEMLLLLFHKKLQCWLQPGGHADGEDDLLKVAQRELLEECGISPMPYHRAGEIFDIDRHEIPAVKQEPAHFHYDVRYLFKATNEQIQGNDESESVRWFPLQEVLAMNGMDDSVYRCAARIQNLKLW